jgi:tRNA A37 N6-isopentenylltransferase MiaA
VTRKRIGVVAKLPKAVRKRINVMLDDGLRYAEVIERLGKRGQGLTVRQLSSWWRGGYQDWREENQRLEGMKARREFALQVVKQNEGNAIQEAALHIAATHIYELLMQFDPAKLRESFKGNAEDYARIVRALTLISSGGISFEQHKTKVAAVKAQLEKELREANNEGGLRPETLRRIEEQVGLL